MGLPMGRQGWVRRRGELKAHFAPKKKKKRYPGSRKCLNLERGSVEKRKKKKEFIDKEKETSRGSEEKL